MCGWITVRKLHAMDSNEVHLLNYGAHVTLGYLYLVLHFHTLLQFGGKCCTFTLLHSVNRFSYSGDCVLRQRQNSAIHSCCQSGEIKHEI